VQILIKNEDCINYKKDCPKFRGVINLLKLMKLVLREITQIFFILSVFRLLPSKLSRFLFELFGVDEGTNIQLAMKVKQKFLVGNM